MPEFYSQIFNGGKQLIIFIIIIITTKLQLFLFFVVFFRRILSLHMRTRQKMIRFTHLHICMAEKS